MGEVLAFQDEIEAPALVSYEAEQALLGGLLVNPAAHAAVAATCGPGDFADAVHGRIFEAMGEMAAQGLRADPVTLARQFNDDAGLNRPETPVDMRGAKYLFHLLKCYVVSKGEYLADYGAHIADLAKRRRLNAMMADLATLNLRSLDPDFNIGSALQNLEGEIAALRSGPSTDPTIRDMGQIMDAVLEQAEAAYKGGAAVRGIATGLTRLDAILNGLCAGDMVVLAARPAMGKTAWANSVARNVAALGKRVGIESIEMTAEQLGLRSLAGDSGVNTTKVRAGAVTEGDMGRLIAAAGELRGLPITIAATSAPTGRDILNRWALHKSRHGLDLLIIDYLQLVRPSDKRVSRYEEVTVVSSEIKAAAKQLGIPVIALAQLSREVEKRDNKRPVLSDLRDSGAVEQDADQVVFLYRHQYYLEKEEPQKRVGEDPDKFSKRIVDWQAELDACAGQAECIVAKNRHGITGTAKVRFDADRQRFEDLDARGGTVSPADDPNDQWWQGQN